MFQKSISIILFTLLFILLAFTVVFLLIFLAPKYLHKTPTLATTITPTLSSQHMDRSILTGDPCQAPCWYGLELGKSTKSDVIRTIENLTFLDPENISTRASSYWDDTVGNVNSTRMNVGRIIKEYGNCVGFNFVDDEIKTISIIPNYPLSFKELVDSIGKPDYVQVFYLQNNVKDCDVTLEWTKRGIEDYDRSAGLENQEYCTSVIEGKGVYSNLYVDTIVYCLPGHISLIDVPSRGRDFPWVGFISE